MQAKGFIKFIIVALIVASIFQLSFTVIKNTFVNKAESYASSFTEGMEKSPTTQYLYNEKKNYYLDSIKNEEAFLGFTYEKINSRSLNLGLDLKGGVSMLVEIDQADVLRKLANNSKDKNFNAAIDAAMANQASSQEDFITAFGNEYKKIAGDAKLSGIFAPIEKFREKISFESSNDDVLDVLKEEALSKNKETHNVLTTRIDEFGVAQPFISEPDQAGRIYIELPGADNTDRIRSIIQSSANLEFYKTVDPAVAGNYLVQANEVLVGLLGLEEEEVEQDILGIEESVLDESVETLEETAEVVEDVIDTTLGSLENDLNDDLGTIESTDSDSTANNGINPLFDILGPSIDFDNGNQWANTAHIGSVQKKDLNKVKEYLAFPEVQNIFDVARIKLSWSAKPYITPEGVNTGFYFLYALQKEADLKPAISGDIITNSFPSYDEFGAAIVNMRFNKVGGDEFKKVTGELANADNETKRAQFLAIVLDDKVFSSPRVQDEIPGGGAVINGMDNFQEADDLSTILKSGRLDAQINIPQEAVVGASLGDKSIKSGLMALALGFLVVFLFMVLYYSNAGWIANIALLVNLVLIMGTLASLGAALTLPGLAGIVLTIGMAVDANVIIFERIKEELRKGKGTRLAISDGFSRSYSAIIDANVTTLITAVTLLWLGAGPVKGFAIVLIIGIIASFISAVFLSRLIFDGLSDRDKEVKTSMSWSENLLKDVNYDFIGKRKIAYAVSAFIIVAGIISMFAKGFELGVDFKGGRSYVVTFDKEVSTDDVRSDLTEVFGSVPTVKTFGDDQTVQIITSYEIESKDPKTDSTVTHVLFDALKGEFTTEPSKEDFMRTYLIQSNKVDTSIADDIKSSALKAGLVGAALIFFYLLIRFRKWQYGVGALGAVVHDTLILLSLFSILWGDWFPFSLEIEQKFIAAVLTVIGYSINDTVIVFDRIREHFEEHPTKDIITNVNEAINNTLSRTLMTSFTTIIVVLILFIFGGEAIRGFSFALLVGILVGTYSSIFIASSILVDTLKTLGGSKSKAKLKE